VSTACHMASNTNAIVTCCSANWLPFAAVTMLSCSQNVRSFPVDLYVLALEPSEIDRKKFSRFCEIHNLQVALIAIPPEAKASALSVNSMGLATLMPLFLPQYLPESYKRVLYVDSDLLVEKHLAPLFEIDMQGKSLAAVEDWASFPIERTLHLADIGFPCCMPRASCQRGTSSTLC
jgi:lipopolysaccharide biosynthesis glycosyltransferase